MNYGKLAYTALKDTNSRVEYLEKNKNLNYSNAGSSQSNIAKENFLVSDRIYFTLKVTTPLLIEINLDSAATSETTCDVEVFLDEVSVHKMETTFFSSDLNKLARINVNEVKKGDHVVYIAISQVTPVIDNINVTCFASGIVRDKSKSMVRATTIDGKFIVGKKNKNTMELYADGKLKCLFFDMAKFDILAIDSKTVGALIINNKKELYYSVFKDSILSNILLDENVNSCAVCDCVSKYSGFGAYIKNGELYFFEIIDKTFFPMRKIDVGIKSLREVNFVRNSVNLPIMLVTSKNKNSYVIKCVDDVLGADKSKVLVTFLRV